MKCLIIAAGQGSRLRSIADVKPLIPLRNTPLIERVIDSAMEAGADDFYVVAKAVFAPKFFIKNMIVVGNHGIGCLKNTASRTVILFQLNDI